jgi:DNA gyrase subunit A
VLPTKLPNLLINGASGIAVGMATSVPPHNLNEVCDALIFMLDRIASNRNVTINQLLNFVKGPDFPTGGILYRYASSGKKDDAEENDLIKTGYAVGRGRVTVQAKVHIEKMSRNRHRLVITELPYQTNKANLSEKIADLARDGKIEGLADLRDESDRQGMRLVIELTRTVEPRAILKQLFKMTPLQSTFSINMLALVEGEPRLLPLKQSLRLFIEHRQEIITRRSRYELDKAKQRAHVLEGLQVALANLDEIIATIRRSRTIETAKKNLRKTFKLSSIQAGAILDMPLRRLAALERKKIETEYKEVLKQIKYLQNLLKSPKKILGVIKDELNELKEKFGSPRRTLIVDKIADRDTVTTARDLVPAEDVVVTVTQNGKICCWPAKKGLDPARGRQKDPLTVAVSANTRDTLYLFTAEGRVIIIPMHQVPRGEALGDGPNLGELSLGQVEEVVAGLALPKAELTGYLFLVSRQSRVKRISLSDMGDVRGNKAIVMGLDKGDTLLTAFTTKGQGEVILVSARGQGIRFAEEEVRAMGLSAAGVWGIKLAKNDKIVGAGPLKSRGDLIIVTENGLGKRINMSQFSRQGRHGQGVIALPMSEKSGLVVAAAVVNLGNRVMMISKRKNSKTVYARALPKMTRTKQGKSVMSIRGKDGIAHVVVLET